MTAFRDTFYSVETKDLFVDFCRSRFNAVLRISQGNLIVLTNFFILIYILRVSGVKKVFLWEIPSLESGAFLYLL